MKRIPVLSIVLICSLTVVCGQAPEKKTCHPVYINEAPAIDGQLTDEVWNTGEWIDDFTQFEPYNGQKPSQRTEFKILYDNDNIYTAIKSYDTSPDSIVKRLTRRDQIDGDMAGIVFDSYHDLRTGFLFGTSFAGVKFDQMMTNDGQDEDETWDPNWWVATSLASDGWIAEMKIPFSQLRFDKNSGDVWGLEVFRTLYRKNEMSFWQHIPKDAPGLIHMMGEINGLGKIRPRKIFDVTPYGVARAETFEAEAGNPFLESGKRAGGNIGLDAKIGITNNMTMDLTINPDFGQVEADPSVVNLTAYETFYEEKRPFFIEGNNITSFGLGLGDGDVGNDNLFYSRRIGRRPQGDPELEDDWYSDVPGFTTILGAAKLTGKTKKGLSVGIVEAVTAEEKAEIDKNGERSYETVEPLTNYFIGRVQRDFDEGNTIFGGMITSTNRKLDENLGSYMHKAAFTGGLDFMQYFDQKNWVFSVKTAFSTVRGTDDAIETTQLSSARYFQRPDNNHTRLDTNRTSLTGNSGKISLQKINGHWNFGTATIWKTPGFETNDLGYLRDADQLMPVIFANYKVWDPKWIYRDFSVYMDVFSIFNFGGVNQMTGIEGSFFMNLKNYWTVSFYNSLNGPVLSTSTLRGGPMMKIPGEYNSSLFLSTDSRKKIVFSTNGGLTARFEKSTWSIMVEAGASLKPTNYLRLSVNPEYSRSFSELQYVSTEEYGTDDRYIFSDIKRETVSASLRININLSPDLTLEYWGQPFIATGRYSDYKYISDKPLADRFSDRFIPYSSQQISPADDEFNIDENSDGTTDYTFDRQDFNVQEFLSNLVIRWEYNPGSTLYLVWSQTRSGSNESDIMQFSDSIGNLFDGSENKPANIFLIKLSCRFGLR